jgi:predicted permease
VRPILLLLLCGTLLLLLIACVNVSSLLLVRTEARRREIAVRAALGAGRGRMVRQFVTEGVTLVTAASLLGLSTAYVAMHLLLKLIPASMMEGMPYLKEIGLHWHVVLFAGVIACVACVQFSLIPVMRMNTAKLRDALADGGRGTAGTLWRRLGANLVVAELVMVMVLLVGAGLLGKSFYLMQHAELGMMPDHVAVLQLRAPQAKYATDVQTEALAQQVTREVERLPGVETVGLCCSGGNTTFLIAGRPGTGEGNESSSRVVSEGYFATLKTRLLQGRYFSEADDAAGPKVMMINKTFARKFFPGEDPIGKRIQYDTSEPMMEIVGVVDDIREGPLDAENPPVLYTPFAQGPERTFFVMARTVQAPEGLLPTLAGVVHQIDPGILTTGADTMTNRMNNSQSAYMHRSSALLVGGFAVIALLLGVIGLYGVVAYSVNQRTCEIGVRMALGAQRGTVYRMIFLEAGRLTAIGIAGGLLCSVGVATLMRKLLFATQPWDLQTLVGVAVVLGVSALAASYLPARRAASVNPMEALRAE